MRLFRDNAISTKLICLTAFSVSIALGLSFAVFLFDDVRSLREAKKRQVGSLARVVGANSVSALDFDDRKSAETTLASLASQPSIETAILYDSKGEVFATYPAELADRTSKFPVREPLEQSFGDEFIEVHSEIEYSGHFGNLMQLDNELSLDDPLQMLEEPVETDEPSTSAAKSLATIVIRANTSDIREQVASRTKAAIAVFATALLVSLVITRLVQRLITRPIDLLVQTARHIEKENDYSYRAPVMGGDEVGVLGEAFNDMLEEIETSRGQLQDAHDDLEQRVVERTQELRDAMIEAQAANRTKSDFLANMSHEIRTPMTSILGYTDLLVEEESVSGEGRERIDTIQRNGRHLLSIINDILDVSKIEAGKITVEKIDCSVNDVLTDLYSLLCSRAQEKNIDLRVEYKGEVPDRISTDPTRLRQILFNLIGNAIKFTNDGGVRVVVSTTQRSGTAEPYIHFNVIDSGIGLTEKQIKRIFNAFTQADETMARRFGGTGLGLTISKGLADLLGGSVSVKSAKGEGSTFSVCIPTGPLEGVPMSTSFKTTAPLTVETTGSTESPEALGAKFDVRVLLVEDGIDNQKLISLFLKKAGVSVEVAENGLIGRDKATEAWTAGKPFDLVLMDMQMPVLDGYSATSQLREAGYDLPIVALTAHAMNHEREKCLNAGCDDYFTKPIDRKKLVSVVESWATKPKTHESATE